MVYVQKENEIELVEAKSQPVNIETMNTVPMEIDAESHITEVRENGEMVRRTMDGQSLGNVTNADAIKAIKEELKRQEQEKEDDKEI